MATQVCEICGRMSASRDAFERACESESAVGWVAPRGAGRFAALCDVAAAKLRRGEKVCFLCCAEDARAASDAIAARAPAGSLTCGSFDMIRGSMTSAAVLVVDGMSEPRVASRADFVRAVTGCQALYYGLSAGRMSERSLEAFRSAAADSYFASGRAASAAFMALLTAPDP